jgi:hypothetical protein
VEEVRELLKNNNASLADRIKDTKMVLEQQVLIWIYIET